MPSSRSEKRQAICAQSVPTIDELLAVSVNNGRLAYYHFKRPMMCCRLMSDMLAVSFKRRSMLTMEDLLIVYVNDRQLTVSFKDGRFDSQC